MEFFKDKTCAIEDGGFRIGCTWTLLDDGRTKIEFGAFGVKSIGFATVKGDELQLLDKARGNDTFLRADSPSFRQMKNVLASHARSKMSVTALFVSGKRRIGLNRSRIRRNRYANVKLRKTSTCSR